MLEKGPKIFAPSARFVGVVVRPGQMGLRPEVIRYPKKGQFSYLGVCVDGQGYDPCSPHVYPQVVLADSGYISVLGSVGATEQRTVWSEKVVVTLTGYHPNDSS